jgi:Ribosomal proteins 50S L24/mitochondrial 39S L24
VAVISPGDGLPTRVGYRIDEVAGVRHKVRVCKRTGAEL